MARGYTARNTAEMESIHHGLVTLVGAELDVESFGMQILNMPGGFTDYPSHDHSEDGQEEVYVVLEGSADFQLDDERVRLGRDDMLRVAPEVVRSIRPGAEGARILALGCTRSGAYERPQDFRVTGARA